MQVLGTPTREQIEAMNPSYRTFKFPQIKAQTWDEVCACMPQHALPVQTSGLYRRLTTCGLDPASPRFARGGVAVLRAASLHPRRPRHCTYACSLAHRPVSSTTIWLDARLVGPSFF